MASALSVDTSERESKTYNQVQRLTVKHVAFSTLENLTLRVFAVGTMYAVGYWRISPIWLVVVWGLLRYRDHKRLKNLFKQYAASSIAMRDKRKLVISNVKSLPSWVHFTDLERCEWLNSAIGHLWPSMVPYMVRELKNYLEPTLNEALSAYKSNPIFVIKSISIGSLSPRISAVKVHYEGASRVERATIDLNLIFFSDCSFDCSLMNNIGLGADKFQLKGRLRTDVSWLEGASLPGVEVYFLQQPEMRFNFSGVLGFSDVPIVGKICRSTVEGLLASSIVLPNKCVVHYEDISNIEQLKFPEPEGLLRVNVIEARGLGGTKPLYYSSTKSPDAYATITFGAKTYMTTTVTNSMDPVWNFTAEFFIASFFEEVVQLSIDDQKRSRNLGTLSLSLQMVEKNNLFHSWQPLEDVSSGMVNLRISYHKLEKNVNLSTSKDLPAILQVFIDDVKGLLSGKCDVLAEISIGNILQTSKTVPISNPIFKEEFSFSVTNPHTEILCIKLINVTNNKVLGEIAFEILKVVNAKKMEVINEHIKSKRGLPPSVAVSMRLRTFKS